MIAQNIIIEEAEKEGQSSQNVEVRYRSDGDNTPMESLDKIKSIFTFEDEGADFEQVKDFLPHGGAGSIGRELFTDDLEERIAPSPKHISRR